MQLVFTVAIYTDSTKTECCPPCRRGLSWRFVCETDVFSSQAGKRAEQRATRHRRVAKAERKKFKVGMWWRHFGAPSMGHAMYCTAVFMLLAAPVAFITVMRCPMMLSTIPGSAHSGLIRGAGYSGPKYCQRCSEVFRDHIVRQKPNSAMCNRKVPDAARHPLRAHCRDEALTSSAMRNRQNACADCFKVLQHFNVSEDLDVLWQRFDDRAKSNQMKSASAKRSSTQVPRNARRSPSFCHKRY